MIIMTSTTYISHISWVRTNQIFSNYDTLDTWRQKQIKTHSRCFSFILTFYTDLEIPQVKSLWSSWNASKSVVCLSNSLLCFKTSVLVTPVRLIWIVQALGSLWMIFQFRRCQKWKNLLNIRYVNGRQVRTLIPIEFNSADCLLSDVFSNGHRMLSLLVFLHPIYYDCDAKCAIEWHIRQQQQSAAFRCLVIIVFPMDCYSSDCCQ